MLDKLKAFWALTRLENGLIIAGSFVVSLIIAYQSLPSPRIWLPGAAALIFAEICVFALNDYIDVEIDRKNNRMDRPIVRGDLSRSQVLAITVVSFLLTSVAAILIWNPLVVLVGIVMVGFCILYNVLLKTYGFGGNLFIAFASGAPFLFTSLLYRQSTLLYVIAATGFFAGLAREILKGIWDTEGDALRNVKTVARVFGKVPAKYSGIACVVMTIILLLIPYFVNIEAADQAYYHSNLYLGLAALSILALLYLCSWVMGNPEASPVNKIRYNFQIALTLGLIAFLVPALL